MRERVAQGGVTRRARAAASALAAVVVASIAATNALGAASEDEIKAAFLFNFARYVEWPSEAFPSETSPVTIGVVGDDDFPRVLRAVVSGKQVVEFTVTTANKGDAVRHLSDRTGATMALYLGDDVTDEDGFGAVAERGLGIIVGPGERPTRASQALADPVEVRQFLELLADGLANAP